MMIDESWQGDDGNLALARDRVIVWRVDLDVDERRVMAMRHLLTPDEVARADRYKFDRHRRRFTMARAILRTQLGHYLNKAPKSVVIQTTSFGKPFVDQPFASNAVRFNVSHSHELALIAFTQDAPIGVDLEWRYISVDHMSIANKYFSAEEVRQYVALPPEQQEIAFYNCWTRKEAYIKAIGEGLSHPLDDFIVAFLPGEPARLVSDRSDPDAPKIWQFAALNLHEDYASAICVKKSDVSAETTILCRSMVDQVA